MTADVDIAQIHDPIAKGEPPKRVVGELRVDNKVIEVVPVLGPDGSLALWEEGTARMLTVAPDGTARYADERSVRVGRCRELD